MRIIVYDTQSLFYIRSFDAVAASFSLLVFSQRDRLEADLIYVTQTERGGDALALVRDVVRVVDETVCQRIEFSNAKLLIGKVRHDKAKDVDGVREELVIVVNEDAA